MKRTLFVTGAGASAEFGLPVGAQLAERLRIRLLGEIDAAFSPTESILGLAMQSGLDGKYGDAARDLCGGLITARSVDRLMHSRSDRPLVAEIGKCGISLLLGEAERQSSLGQIVNYSNWHSVQESLTRCNSTWLASLFSYLHEGVRPCDSASIFQNCSFVTFNYDRCIQRYLYMAFTHILNLTSDESEALVSSIPIHHVYGSLGSISENRDGVPFGPEPYFARNSISKIRTFTEGTDDGTLEVIRQCVADADLIVCLGFSFDDLNMRALFGGALSPDQRMFATTLNLPGLVADSVQKRLASARDQFHFSSTTCNALINNEYFQAAITAP